jgi:hypothetical protein
VLPSARYPYVGHVVHKHGRKPIPITAIDAGRKSEKHRRPIQATIDQLNQVLDDWRIANANPKPASAA